MDMYNLIKSMPDMIKKALDIKVPQIKEYNNLTVFGMGGSGFTGDIIKLLLKDKYFVYTYKDYNYPCILPEGLKIFVSYSGNTEETLSHIINKESIAIGSGGKLEQYFDRNRYIKIPSGLPPRAAIAYLSVPLLKMLGYPEINIKSISNKLIDIDDSIEKRAKNLAKKIGEKLIIVYADSYLTYPVVYRWETQLNENAKVLAHTRYMSEMNHNEIMVFENPTDYLKDAVVFFLHTPLEHKRTKKRFDVMKKIIKNIEIIDIYPVLNEDAAYFELIMLGDMLSYFIAKERNINPIPVKLIESLKEKIK